MSGGDTRGRDARRETAERLLRLLGELPDDLLEEAAQTESREDFERLALAGDDGGKSWLALAGDGGGKEAGAPSQPGRAAHQEWKRYGACAACLCLLLLGIAVWRLPPGDTGSSPQTTAAGMPAAGGRGEEGNVEPEEGGGAAQGEADGTAPAEGGAMPGEGGGTVTGGSGVPGGKDGEEEKDGIPGGGPAGSADGNGAAGSADGSGTGSGENSGEEGGFWYAGLRYIRVQEPALPALPEGVKQVGTLVLAGAADSGDWTTWDVALSGCAVYAAAGGNGPSEAGGDSFEAGGGPFEAGVLYVGQECGYCRYRPEQE